MLAYTPFLGVGINPLLGRNLLRPLGQTTNPEPVGSPFPQPAVPVSDSSQSQGGVGVGAVVLAAAIPVLFYAANIGVSAYHGYKRNKNSAGWGFWWGLMGLVFPVVTPAVAIAEGYGKRPRK